MPERRNVVQRVLDLIDEEGHGLEFALGVALAAVVVAAGVWALVARG